MEIPHPCPSVLLKVGEITVDWKPWLVHKHQIVWVIPCHSGLGGIIGMHYFGQMAQPVGFFIFSQLPNHLHDSLMGPLHQPFHLGVMGDGLQFLHAEEFAHLANNAAL